jgi:hypothetical protein
MHALPQLLVHLSNLHFGALDICSPRARSQLATTADVRSPCSAFLLRVQRLQFTTRGWLVAGCVVLIVGGCGRPPVGGLRDSDVGRRDTRAPDVSRPDRSTRDIPTKNDIGPCVALGAICSVDSDCCPVMASSAAKCIPLGTGVKVCSVPCTTDDLQTPLVNEDTCRALESPIPSPFDLSKYVCLPVPIGIPATSQTYCVLRCEPTKGANTCPAGLACDPRSTQIVCGCYLGCSCAFTAACVYPPCTSGLDCPVFLADSCGGGAACKPGTTCLPVEADSTTTRCAQPGMCDITSGLCAPNLGGGKGVPGTPCKSDLDCLPQGRCDFERQTAAGLYARNGYCTIEGCTFAKTLPDRACPTGSICNGIRRPGGQCYKNCSQPTTDCRGDPNDQYGDYECYQWYMEYPNGRLLVPPPPSTCEPVIPCTLFQALPWLPLGCAFLGKLNGYGTSDLACRDRTTGAKVGTAIGICLQDPCPLPGCPAGGVCCNGTCCSSATTCCYGTCVDLNTDKNHCGACEKWCAAIPINQTCVAGKCVP